MPEKRSIIRFLILSIMLLKLPMYSLDNYNDEGLVIIFDSNSFDNQEQEIFPLYDNDAYQESELLEEIEPEEQLFQHFTIKSNDIIVCEQGFDFKHNSIQSSEEITPNNEKDGLSQTKLVKKQKKQKLSRKEKKLKNKKYVAA